ncbi:hypothetical protein ACFPOB_29600 [Bosea eneae]|uniref:Uncharacterized protein n=1 Tax=Bosea eneae TaxID=151454 RepID=A0ABW0IZR8_9HYPH
MTTPTPAQADEKALEDIVRRIREQCASGGARYQLTIGEAVDLIRPNFAALRPEGEAVAIGWVERSDLAVLARIKGQTGACRITAIRAVPGPGDQPLFVSPPAPAGVKVRPLDWNEPAPPNGKDRFYDHVQAETPFGQFLIEWKSWKENDSFTISFAGDYVETRYSLDDAKAFAFDFLSNRISSSLLSSSTEAQAGSPAEALPSQTSGAEGGEAQITAAFLRISAQRRDVPENVRQQMLTAAALLTVLAKPASEPAGGGVRTGRRAIVHAVVCLGAAISLLERTPKAKKAAPSDRMFGQMLRDYRKALDEARAALSSPASSSPAEAEALPAGVEAVRAVSNNGKRWRIVPVDGDWEMQPVGHITAGQAERLCKAIEAALVDGGQPVPDRDGADGTERLCRALYGRKAATRDYLGGSDARMLHDAADRLASLSPAPYAHEEGRMTEAFARGPLAR